MNQYAVLHKPESNFAYATADDTIAVILRVARNDRFDRIEILYNNKYDFTKLRHTAPMRECADDGTYKYYRGELTLADARFAYVFKLTQKGKTYYYSEEGVSSDYRFDIAYYTFFQFPFINSVDVLRAPEWVERAVFYQIFVDRFCRGDYLKDDSYVNVRQGQKIDRYSFAGGDLDGIAEKLDFLKDEGFNALYLTPIFLSPSNHKYNVTDYLTVDPQFGTNEKLQRLLASAHGKGVKVMLDCVFNHCDRSHEYFKDAEEKGRASEYYDWFLIDGDFPSYEKGNYACFADCKYMPKWNTSNAKVRRYLTDVALEYMRMGFDGLRFDVADEISHELWRQIRREVKAEFPQAYLVGEVWHLNEAWLRGDQFDGVMNYKLQKILADYFGGAGIPAKHAANRMNALLMQNTEAANGMAFNFLDNHDTARFLRVTGGNRDKLLCALCAAVMFPGVPCVFYGTELPLDGGSDPDCRQPFDWRQAGQPSGYREKLKEILSLKRRLALTGGRAEIKAESGMLNIARAVADGTVKAQFNTGRGTKKTDTDGEVIFGINYENGKILSGGAVVVKYKK